MPHSATPYLIIAFVALFMVLRLARSMRGRQIKMNSLWIVPAIMIVYAGMDLYRYPPTGALDIAARTLAALLGAGVGWWRGRLTRIDLDHQTGVLTSRASPAAVIVIILLLAVRYGLRIWIAESGKGGSLIMLSNALLFFGFAMLAGGSDAAPLRRPGGSARHRRDPGPPSAGHPRGALAFAGGPAHHPALLRRRARRRRRRPGRRTGHDHRPAD
jgi:hypothetical protein